MRAYPSGVEPLAPGLDLAAALERVAATGAAFVPRALAEPFRSRLQSALESVDLRPVPASVGPVRQETEAASLPPGRVPEADLLCRAFVRAVREAGRGIRGLATWRPDDVTVQRYRAGALGITPHLDGRRFRRLVAVFTTAGSARFTLHETREGAPVETWEAGPGSLVLLRGPGLGGLRDGRPFHAVAGPRAGARYSLALRMAAPRRLESGAADV